MAIYDFYKGTTNTGFTLPENKIMADFIAKEDNNATKDFNFLHLSITNFFVVDDLFNNVTVETFSATSRYSFPLNMILSIEYLYAVYNHAFSIFKAILNEVEKEVSIIKMELLFYPPIEEQFDKLVGLLNYYSPQN